MKGLFLCGYGCTPWIWKDTMYWKEQYESQSFVSWPEEKVHGFLTGHDFAVWILEEYSLEGSIDYIIGHSLGGLVALELLRVAKVQIKQIVLVESFLKPPKPFFQNLLMADTDKHLREWIEEMISRESPNYSGSLQVQLLNPNVLYLDLLKNVEVQICLLYGDRGESDVENVFSHLALPSSIRSSIPIKFIPNSCHFPMLENSAAFNKALNETLSLGL